MFSGPLLHIAGLVAGEARQPGLLERGRDRTGTGVLLVHGVGSRLTGRLLALSLKLVVIIVSTVILLLTVLPPLLTEALPVSAVLTPEENIFYCKPTKRNITSWPPCLCGRD